MRYTVKFNTSRANFAFKTALVTGFLAAMTVLAARNVFLATPDQPLWFNGINLVVFTALTIATFGGIYGALLSMIESIVVESKE